MVGVTGETVRDRMRQTRMIKEEKDLTTHSFRIDAAIKLRELVYWGEFDDFQTLLLYPEDGSNANPTDECLH